MLYGIDVSSNQPANICSMVPIDFAIVKATGNPKSMKWNYANPYMKQQTDEALSRTGCAGLYHFTHGGQSAETEADLFIEKAKPYIGRVMLVIDYENEAVKNGREWLRAFIKRIKSKTGVNPVVYASSSVIREQRLVALCKEENCGIWSANYYAGYKSINGYNTTGLKMDIAESVLWQFTSSGYLSGYNGALDLDVFYGDKDAWLAYCSTDGSVPVAPETPSNSSKIAEDGLWGTATTRKLQEALGTTVDGIISGQSASDLAKVNGGGLQSSTWRTGAGGSQVIRAMQKKIGVKKIDGYFGTDTAKTLQRYMGTKEDGVISKPSQAVKELQKRLNAGNL